MPTSDEYLAKLGFEFTDLNQAKAEVVKFISAVSDQFDDFAKDAERAESAVLGVGRGSRTASTGVQASTKAAAEGSAAWKAYAKQLSDAQAAYREFRKGQITGEGGGKAAPTGSEAQRLLDIEAAGNANVTAEIRRREKANADAAKAADRAAAQSIAAIERETQAQVRGYSRQVAEAEEAYRRIERARKNAAAEATFNQNARRYAEPQRASNNVASPAARQQAQDGYSQQQLKALGDYYRAQEQLTSSNQKNTESLITQRYALYDVATTYGAVGAAALAASTYAITVGAQFERAFTDVERTLETGASSAAIADIREQLIELSTQIPLTFQDLSKIATLGNQLGVGAADLTEFTEVVAQFSTVTGLTAEASAQAFGRISNILGIPITNARQLGSAIALVGRESAATEQEIVGLTERLGASATRAGFTADQVVGLAGALGSLGVAPERAQGVFETYFNTLNSSLAEGGDSLRAFSIVTGKTEEQINSLVRSGRGFEVFQSFLQGLQGADTVELTQALGELNLEGLRSEEVLGRITQRLPLLQQAFATAAQGYGEGTELARQFATIVDDLASQFQMLINNINALIETVSGGMVPGLAGAIGLLNQFVTFLRELASTPAGQVISQLGISLTVLVGIMFALQAANALATASTLALVSAQSALQAKGAGTGVLGLIAQLTGLRNASVGAAAGVTATGAAASGASVGLSRFGTALAFVGKMTVLLAILQAIISLVTDFRGTMQGAVGVVSFLTDASVNAANGVRQLFNQFADLVGIIPVVGGMLADFIRLQGKLAGGAAGGVGSVIGKDLVKNMQGFVNTLPKAKTGLDSVGSAAKAADLPSFGQDVSGLGGKLDGLGDSASGAADEVRTLVDYANDLSGIQTRSFEIRFGGEMAYDKISSGWNTVSKAISDTNDQIREYQATMATLSADRSIRAYWLSVAENYGDTLRAGKLRAEIAEIDSKLSKTSSDLTAAQEKNSGVLTGNTQAAIDNRATLTGLVQNYQSYITALASSGAEQSELTAETARAKQEFIAQATALGYPIDQVMRYAKAFDDTRTAIERVPRNITVQANADPALQALNEFVAKARNIASNSGIRIPIGTSTDSSGAADTLRTTRDSYQAQLEALYKVTGGNSNINTGRLEQAIVRINQQLRGMGYRSGGYTGDGSPSDVAGIVHKREFVLNERGTGVFSRAELDAANRGVRPLTGGGGSSTIVKMPDVMMVELSPYDRELLADGKSVTVLMRSDDIASATSSSFAGDSHRGGG